MSLTLNPPPINVPPELAQTKANQNFFSTLLNTIYQLWTATYGIRAFATVETTNNDVTALLRTPVRSDTTVMIDCRIVARRTNSATGNSAYYVLTGAYKNVGGTLTGIGSPILQGGEDQSSWNVGFSTNGTDAVVTVKGNVDNEITWEGAVSVYTVGS